MAPRLLPAVTPRQRVRAALARRPTDRMPLFEVWIDDPALIAACGRDAADTYVALSQDAIMLPSRASPGSAAWDNGVDEFGCVWRDGMYAGGAVATDDDLRRYTPPLADARAYFDTRDIAHLRRRYPDHVLIYGSHVGPFTAAFMAIGMESFFAALVSDPEWVHRVLRARTDWCVALYRHAAALGMEVAILGDDAGANGRPMVSPRMWREFILPYHREIVAALPVPVFWHSDGDITTLLPAAVEAGFVGVHGLEPAAGVDLAWVKREFGRQLVLIGNVDTAVLGGDDLAAVRGEVDRSVAQGAPGGGYLFSSCNSIFSGMNLAAVQEMYRYAAEIEVAKG